MFADLNDRVPILDEDNTVLTHSLTEDTTPGTFVERIKLSDKDVDAKNTKLKFELTGDADGKTHFKIDATSGVITTAKAFDFESKTSYDLAVQVADLGDSPGSLSAKVALKITIKDVNDLAPVITSNTDVTKTIPESTGSDTLITQVTAKDGDTTAVSGNIVFEIDKLSSGYDYFKIDKATGKVSTNDKGFDFETQRTYELSIFAQDSGSPSLRSKDVVKLVIKISDVNDQPPVFANKLYEVTITEAAQGNQKLVQVAATDADEPNTERSQLTFKFQKGDVRFVCASDGVVSIAADAKFDFEGNDGQGPLLVTLLVSDGDQSNTLTDTAQVKITVTDANDNAPKITSTLKISKTFAETNNVPFEITKVTASDADSKEAGGTVKFRFLGSPSKKFAISETSGLVVAQSGFDFENTDERKFTLNVEAYDSGPDGQGGTRSLKSADQVEIVVAITDINDNPPELDSLSYKATVYENEKDDKLLLSVAARDTDGDAKNRVLTFSLENNDDNYFQIETDSTNSKGIVRAAKTFDREKITSLKVDIVVTDNGGLTDKAVLTVQVLDKNDEKPKFLDSSYAESVGESVALKQKIAVVRAKDLDDAATVNAQIEYTLTKGNDDGNFQVDKETGAITVAHTLT